MQILAGNAVHRRLKFWTERDKAEMFIAFNIANMLEVRQRKEGICVGNNSRTRRRMLPYNLALESFFLALIVHRRSNGSALLLKKRRDKSLNIL
jgi:hypothetical protein